MGARRRRSGTASKTARSRAKRSGSNNAGAPRRGRRLALLACLSFVAATVVPVLCLRVIPAYTSSFMLQRSWQAYADREEGFRLQHQWVPLEETAPVVALAVLASEDQRFLNHPGFDVHELQAAIDEALQGGSLRGGSTLTQQVAKNLFLWPGRSFIRKGLEAYFTLLLEALWPKRRILEVYLNIAEWGDGVYGIHSAAHHFFDRSPSHLTSTQAALLASALPNPKVLRVDRPNSRMRRKQRWIESQLPYLRAVGTRAALGLR